MPDSAELIVFIAIGQIKVGEENFGTSVERKIRNSLFLSDTFI